MTILDLITKAGASAAALKNLLELVIDQVPDLAPAARMALDELEKLSSPSELAALAVEITTELGHAAQLRFDGKTHAGDGA